MKTYPCQADISFWIIYLRCPKFSFKSAPMDQSRVFGGQAIWVLLTLFIYWPLYVLVSSIGLHWPDVTDDPDFGGITYKQKVRINEPLAGQMAPNWDKK